MDLRIELRIRLVRKQQPARAGETLHEHRDTETYVEPGPTPVYPLGFRPTD